jgi:hypothetical protein
MQEPDQLILDANHFLAYVLKVPNSFPDVSAPSPEDYLGFKMAIDRFVHWYPEQGVRTVRKELDPNKAGPSRTGADQGRAVSIADEV